MRKLQLTIVFLLALCATRVAAQGSYSEYEDLYPGCIDNQESKIYGGTYGDWPKGLNPPEFPNGGDVQLTRYVMDNMEYPHVVEGTDTITGEEILAKGTVAVQIVVDRCGRATRQEIIQSINDEYDQEALRILSDLPVFKPGDLDGERVKVALIVPVRFNRNKMPPPPKSDYGDFWGDDDSSSSYDDSDSYSSGGKYDNVQWDDSW